VSLAHRLRPQPRGVCSVVKMVLHQDDKTLIEFLSCKKGLSLNKILQECPEKQWKRSTVANFLKKLRDTGSSCRRHGSGRPKSVRTRENIDLVKDLVLSPEGRAATSCSERETAKRTGISRTSVQRIIKKDLHLQTFRRIGVHELSQAVRAKRVTRCRTLLRRFKKKSVERILFTDEKIFTVAAPTNTQNDRVRSRALKKRDVPKENLLREKARSRGSVMVSVGVTMHYKSSPIFVPAGAKVNADQYQQVILRPMLRQMLRNVPDLIFQQDGAPAHTARTTVTFLTDNCSAFIEPSWWPPNSPDLNPLDYYVWSAMEQKVYRGPAVQDINDLKERISRSLENLPQAQIARAIKSWTKRLREVVRNGGGHIEPFVGRR
jgi:hypothetical protein